MLRAKSLIINTCYGVSGFLDLLSINLAFLTILRHFCGSFLFRLPACQSGPLLLQGLLALGVAGGDGLQKLVDH